MEPTPTPNSQSTPEIQAHIDAYGSWLAQQEWKYDELGDASWILDYQGRYIAEGVTQDSEGKLLDNEQMQQALRLMHHAPRLLRFVLRGLEVLDSNLPNAKKTEHLQLLLAEVAAGCLRGLGQPLAIAKAVENEQRK